MSDLLSIEDAAIRLDLSPRRVRALVEAGRLKADRVGSQYVLSRYEIDRHERSRAAGGRPISNSNAWALLAILAGEKPGWLGASADWRLRRMLKQEPARVPDALLKSAPRSEPYEWRVLPRDIQRLLDENDDLVVSGLAAQYPEVDVPYLAVEDPLEGYVSQRKLLRLRRWFKPSEDSSRPNLRLKVPHHPWVLSHGPIAPLPVVAADLLEHDDARVERAGAEILERLIHAYPDS